MLTIKQSRLLALIQKATDEGRQTTCRALMRSLGQATPASVHQGIGFLRERGFLAPSTRPLVILRSIDAITDGTPVGASDPMVSMIHDYQKRNAGTSPSVREIMVATGMTSLSQTHRRLLRSERDGHIRRMAGRKTDRAIYVVKEGDADRDAAW